MGRDDDLRDFLKVAVQEFERYDSNPSTWHTWIVYLLKKLDRKSMDINPSHQEIYDDMLSVLQDSIRMRLRNGGW